MMNEDIISSSKYLNQAEAANYLGFAKSTVSLLTARGEITHYRIGRAVRYTLEDLDIFMKSNMSKASGKPGRNTRGGTM